MVDQLDQVDPAQTVTFLNASLYGHPVSAAASLAMMSELEKPGTYDTLFEKGRTLRTGSPSCWKSMATFPPR
ncbi:MAG: hypothetical protein U5K43_10065 [Halofilum sp. (in: g-proteobacteria)]|nr:hypothetical protein [Halofilum sp. (in: g-proteobacteria)]